MANEQLLDTICSTLKETEERPRGQIASILEALGEERTKSLMTETEKIESEGGMPVPDGSRRRTPGGVFFYLARRALPPADRARIFPNNTKPAQAKPPQAPKPPPQPQPARQPPPGPPRRRIIEVDVIPSRAASRANPGERGFDRGRSFERAAPATPASLREQVLQLPAPQRRALVMELVDDLFGLEDATPTGALPADRVAAVREIDLSEELTRRVQALVPDLTALVRLLAARALQTGSLAEPAPESVAPESVAPESDAKESADPAAARRKPAKPAPEDRVIRALEADPGMRIEDLAEELDLPTKQLSPVVKKLLEADRIYATGQKRGTRYFLR